MLKYQISKKLMKMKGKKREEMITKKKTCFT